jgi:hypothetical protein
MTPQFDRQPELGAHPVGARDQDRAAKALQRQLEQRPEPAQPIEYAGAVRGGGQWLDPLDESGAGVDVDSGPRGN